MTPQAPTVDVIVPVYKGLRDTRRCVQSVLLSACRTPWRLVLINDASPEPELSDWLRAVAAADARILLLENDENLGFVGTVNRGMALSPAHDVLLLNSDTEVAGNWLDRLRAAAYGDARVASVTPFSNNATICSYPRFCQDNAVPAGWDTATLDTLFARVNAGQAVDVPTGVGFCMYIRRDALAEVGLFDVEHFGKGYGEENDFCQRAARAGWRNLHALDTFVRHFGGVSFGASKRPREQAAMQTLRRLHPGYEAEVLRFVQRDPARGARLAVDAARMTAGGRPLVLAVLHGRGGGTERHVRELATLLAAQAQFLLLRPAPGQSVSLSLPGADEAFELRFALQGPGFEALLQVLRDFGVCHVHFHHLLDHGAAVTRLPEALGVGCDFTVHDYFSVCPQITLTNWTNGYCGEAGPAQCHECLRRAPAPGHSSIEAWRAAHAPLLGAARHVIVPAHDPLRRVARYLPRANYRCVPHTDLDIGRPLPEPCPAPLQGERRLKVAVLGALNIVKGADVLEDVAVAAQRAQAPVEFHLLGTAYRALKTEPRARLTVHGRYRDEELPERLRQLQPDVVWFPAVWPETYSYTLSACLQHGWPVVAPDIGAFAERLQGRAWSWVRPWQAAPEAWLAFFADIRQRHFATGSAPPRAALPASAAGDAAPPGHEGAEGPAPAGATWLVPQQWYRSAYLAGLPRRAAPLPGPGRALLLVHASDGSGAKRAGHAGAWLLRALVWLRARPWLADVARAIPLRWQTRVKSWLLH